MNLLKWIGLGFLGLALLALALAGGLLVYGSTSFQADLGERPLYDIQADTSAAGLARGEYLATAVMGCTGACHTPQEEAGLPLSGVYERLEMGPIVADFAAPNLTPDMETGLGAWTDAEIARAIREGVGKDGRALVVMPSFNYHTMSDTDTAALIGYLRSLEPVQNDIPEMDANAIGKVMIAMGSFGPNPVGEPITAPVNAPDPGTVEYGGYLVSLAACRDCHGMDLAGGSSLVPGSPPAPDLTQGGPLAAWSQEDFFRAMREGFRPDGTLINAAFMPWEEYGQITDEDLTMIYQYLQTLPAVEK